MAKLVKLEPEAEVLTAGFDQRSAHLADITAQTTSRTRDRRRGERGPYHIKLAVFAGPSFARQVIVAWFISGALIALATDGISVAPDALSGMPL